MTIDEFVEQQKVILAQFAEHWKKENYPNDLEPGEWEEQFLVFIAYE